MTAAGVFLDRQTSGRLALQATTSRTFRKFGDKESVVVTLASPVDPHRGLQNERKQQMLHALKSAAHQGPADYDRSLILDAMEKGVAYPAVHLRFLRTNRAMNGSSDSRGKEPYPENGFPFQGSFDRDLNLHQALYGEVDRIEENVRLLSKPPEPESKAFLIVGFKSIKGSPERMLEESWKEWTGARYLYLNAADEFCLSTIRFFQRTEPSEPVDMFQYIVIAEFENVNENNYYRVLDFVHRLRVNRMNAFTSIYRLHGGGPGAGAEQSAKNVRPSGLKNGSSTSTYWPRFDSSYDSQDSGGSSTVDSSHRFSGSLRGSFDDDLHLRFAEH